MTTGRHGLGGAALIRRQLLVGRGPAALLGVVTLTVAALLAAAPAIFALTATAELQRAVAELSSRDRNLTSVSLGFPATGPPNGGRTGLDPELSLVWGALDGALTSVRANLPAPLAAAVGEPRFVVGSGSFPIAGSPAAPIVPRLSLITDPRMAEQLRLVDGDWPAAASQDGPAEVLLSASTASSMGWAVGEQRALDIDGQPERMVELSGTFIAAEPDADYWSMNRSVLEPEIFDDGNAPRTITGSGYVDPASWTQLRPLLRSPEVRIWFPVAADAVADLPVEESLAQLRQVLAGRYPLVTEPTQAGSVGVEGRLQVLRLQSGLAEVLTEVAGRVTAAEAVLALAVAGPCAAAVAVLGLGVLVLTQRRRPALDFLAGRGASGGQLRALMAVQGALVCVPAALVGIVLASAAVPGELRPAGVAAAMLAGLTPVLALAAITSARTRLPGRGDVSARSPRRVRRVAEVIVVGLAAVSVVVMVQGGVRGSAGIDVLVVAAPLLLTLAACVLAGRLYPIPLQGLHRAIARRPGFVGHVGVVRALRDPAVGVLPALALVAGVSVIAFGAVMLGTLSAGIAASSAAVGADPDRLAASPLLTGLRLTLLTSQVIVGVLCAAAVIMTAVLNSEARNRLLAVLRMLGARTAQLRWLVSWEMMPMAAAALLVGVGLGIGLSALVGRVVDLRPFTGGVEQPVLSVDPVVVGLLLTGFLLVVLAATAVSAVLAQRNSARAYLALDRE